MQWLRVRLTYLAHSLPFCSLAVADGLSLQQLEFNLKRLVLGFCFSELLPKFCHLLLIATGLVVLDPADLIVEVGADAPPSSKRVLRVAECLERCSRSIYLACERPC